MFGDYNNFKALFAQKFNPYGWIPCFASMIVWITPKNVRLSLVVSIEIFLPRPRPELPESQYQDCDKGRVGIIASCNGQAGDWIIIFSYL